MISTKYCGGIHIDRLRSADFAALRALNGSFGQVFDQPQIYTGQDPGDTYLRSILDRDDFIALAARHGDRIVGGLAAYILHKFEQDRREMYIYDLAVDEKYRRQKIATSLVNHLKQIAVQKKVYIIFVQADIDDRPAIKLYESLGLKEEVLHFDIEVVKNA